MNVKELIAEDFIPLVRTYMLCSPAYQHRIIQILGSNDQRNVLFDEFIRPGLFVPDLNQHVAVHREKRDPFSDTYSKALHRSLPTEPYNQIDYTHFSNPLRIPAYGPCRRDKSRQYNREWEPPLRRGAIGLFWAFTFEHDPDDTDGFQMQLDWIWQKDADGPSSLGRLDGYLRKHYRDYRGFTVVWSGGKSIHIHLIFDTAHLARDACLHAAALANTDPDHRLKNWSGDIRDDAVWNYHKMKWETLAGLFKSKAGINVEFDDSLKPLYQKRRMPWAIREAEEGNFHGFPVGTWIPQIVLDERLVKTSPKGAGGWLLTAAEANAVPPKIPAQRSRGTRRDQTSDTELLDAMIDYLAKAWGRDFPRPANVEWLDGSPSVHFYNHANDQHPSTYLGSGHSRLVYRGAGAPSSDPIVAQLPRGMSLDDLVFFLEEQIGRGVPTSSPGIAAPFKSGNNLAVLAHYRHARDQSLEGNRAGLRQAVFMQLEAKPFSVIVTAEGGGKSSTLLDTALSYRLEDCIEAKFPGHGLVSPSRGLQVFASMANDQAREQYRNFVSRRGNQNHAVLLFGFSEYYQQANARRSVGETWEYITHEDALSSGYNSQHDAVYAEQPDIYAQITAEKQQAWMLPNGTSAFDNLRDVIVFTSHAMAQGLNVISKSKAWLHPAFRPDMEPEEWQDLAAQFTVYRLIHDEISVEDLLWIATDVEVAFAAQVRRSIKGWDKATESHRYSAYTALAHNKPQGMNFHKCMTIIGARFRPEDRVSVDFNRYSFGIENSDRSIFRATHGQFIYLKQQDWWERLRARIVITTTERLPVEVVKTLCWSGQGRAVRRFALLELDRDETFPTEHLTVQLDSDASKTGVANLAARLLYDPVDPVDVVITNYAVGSNIYSHKAARGRNDLADKNIATILTFIGPDQYAVLNCIGQKFDIEDPIGLCYRDMLNQDVGRNRGFRSQRPTPRTHRLLVSPRLYRCLGGRRFFGSGRYRFNLDVAA